MNYTENIIFKDKLQRKELSEFEQGLTTIPLSKKLNLYQELVEEIDEVCILKLFVLYLQRNDEILKEFKKTFAADNPDIKAQIVIEQFGSNNRDIIFAAIELVGILRAALAIPVLKDIFKVGDTELCSKIVDVVVDIGDASGANVLQSALLSKDLELVRRSLKALSKRVSEVSWKIFKPLLVHKEPDIRLDAAFAIALRKEKGCAKCFVKALNSETQRNARLTLIRYAGMVPSKLTLKILLNISTHDEYHKARLVATRALDRLQDILEPGVLFGFRNVKDEQIRAEVLFRIGKFGSFTEAHKRYLKETLKKTESLIIKQSCIMALGYISEHSDIELIAPFLDTESITSYNAALALTRIWRQSDNEKILSIIYASHSATQRQIIFKYLIRRRGLDIDPMILLITTKELMKNETNINVKYLNLLLLKFSPLLETFDYLFSFFCSIDNMFIREAAYSSLSELSANYPELFLAYFRNSDLDTCNRLIQFIPRTLGIEFYQKLSAILFNKLGDPETSRRFEDIYLTFTSRHEIAKQILRSLPDTKWKKLFLKSLLKYSSVPLIKFVGRELIEMLSDDDPEIKLMAMKLLTLTKDIEMVPYLISTAEVLDTAEAKMVANSFIKENVTGAQL